VSGTGEAGTLTSSGARFIELLTGDFVAPPPLPEKPKVTTTTKTKPKTSTKSTSKSKKK
jgi:hypothetical protein